MEVTTSGRFRVLGRPRSDDELLLVDVSDADDAMDAAAEAAERGAPGAISAGDYFDPTYLQVDDQEGPQTHLLEMLEPGNLLDATIRWTDGTPRIETAQLVERTRFHFREVGTTFEAAREAWAGAVDADEGINARVTSDAEGTPNGVVYVLAEQPGARDVFEEFVDGVLPLEPLVRRVDRAGGTDGDVPREVFVLRPDEEPFVAVLVALRRNGRLARTVRAQFDIEDPAVDDGDDGDLPVGDDERDGA